MPTARRASLNFNNMNIGVSYRINEEGAFLQDASNVCSNQGRLETRRGTSRYNTVGLASNPISLSSYTKPDDNTKILAKCSDSIYSVSKIAAHTLLKSGLVVADKHRAVTINGRNIIACGGLYSYNGTTFTQLGQAVPAAPDVSAAAGAHTLPTASYNVAYTFYASSIGFETNISIPTPISITLGQSIHFDAAVPATAANALVDKVRVYLKAGTGAYLFIEEVALAATPSDIEVSATSAQIPPTANGLPPSTAKYLASFNSRLVVSGVAGTESDVFMSEQDIPDAFADDGTGVVLFVAGDGPVTGIATGFFSEGVLDPYLVIFKKRQTYVYSEVAGDSRMVEIDQSIGCISPDSIQVINGNVYFMSESGFRAISNGRIIGNKGIPATLSNGAIDDIFNSPGFTYELNKANSNNFHSVYLGRERRFITFVSNMPTTDIRRAYAYEIEYGGFKPYDFQYNINCSCRAEDTSGDEIAILGTDSAFLLSHSDSENRSDVDLSGNDLEISSFAQFSWIRGKDLDASYNFRKLVATGLVSNEEIDLRCWTDYSFNELSENTLDFTGDGNSFILDVSKLDEGILGSGRAPTTYGADINRRGKNICIGFYQSALDSNIGIINMQIDFSKNGNRN